MCGRFTITLEPAFFQQELDLGKIPSEWTPRYNAAPTQLIPVSRNLETHDVEMVHWGLIPFWAKDESIGYKLINARSETLTEKPSFRNAFEKRRCLIFSDGFYEWQKPTKKGERKVPFRFLLNDKKPFAFAGLWESWKSPKEDIILSCTIITCAANALVGKIHDRMPVILDKDYCWRWLEQLPTPELTAMLNPYPAEEMDAYPVSTRVNNPREEDEKLVEPINF
jgi:putative SOS response-associated peptidase YedK